MLPHSPLLYLIYVLTLLKLAQSWCLENSFITNQQIADMTVSPSNRHLAILHSNNLVKIYHTSNYQLLATYNMGTTVNVIRWSPDGNYLAVVGHDDQVRFIQGY
jgi:WD40 repeat protein